jgi:hypothetical protein
MSESHVVSGLVSKRSELAGLIQHYQAEISRISGDLDHLDATIKLFAPEYDLRGIRPRAKRQPNPWFEHGEANRLILDIMRGVGIALTSRAIAEAMITRKGLAATEVDMEAVQKLAVGALRRLEKSGTVREAGRESFTRAYLWELA